LLLGTIAWALAETGLSFWGLVPRLAVLVVLGIVAALAARSLSPGARWPWPLAVGLGLVVIATGISVFQPHGVIEPAQPIAAAVDAPEVVTDPADPANRWVHYGREADSTRYAPFAQIDTGNVARLEVAWTYRTGAASTGGDENQSTRIHVGDSLYLCTPQNKVIALDAATGEPCANVGENGEVDLSRVGMGSRQSGDHEVSARGRDLHQGHAQRLVER